MVLTITNDLYCMDLPGKPLGIDSVADLLANHAKNIPDKAAIVAIDVDTNEETTISYGQLSTLVYQTVTLLFSLGIKSRDRFAILMHNSPEVLLFELAGAIMGATTVPLDFKRDTLERKLFKLHDTGAIGLFMKVESGSTNQDEVEKIKKAYPKLHIMTWSTFKEFQDILIKKKSKNHIIKQASLDSHYVILYTSGTTAHPRGVLLSQRACLLNAMGIIDWQQFTPDDRFNIVLPLHHVNSTEFCLSMLLVGGTIILNSRYSASKFWPVISKYKGTNTSIVPTILHDLLVRYDEFKKQHVDISRLCRICIGSAPVLPEETLRFYDTFHIRVTQGYGQTETALRVSGVPIDSDEKTYQTLVKTNTIGTELANNHLAIMDARNRETPEGKEGEICVAGPILADGYVNDSEDTAKTFKHGWFHSGDLGYWKYLSSTPGVEHKKFFFIIGRIKEIIIKGGVNISPSAIEDALLKAFPDIDQVSVVGYPDERMGEEIAAVVVPKTPHLIKQGEGLKNEILNTAQAGSISGLSPYEYPKKVFIFTELPKTSTGKIQRVVVKKAIAELLAKEKEKEKHYYCRQIAPTEKEILKQAVKINNDRWVGLPATLDKFSARARNGIIFGAFEEKESLVGTISCIQLKKEVVDRLKTWDEATNHGTLANHDPKGDMLLCVAISVVPSSPSLPSIPYLPVKSENTLQKLSNAKIKEYVSSGFDHVLSFHRKPKGDIPGATVWKILENGRPDDKESMGYNVLMKYPTITSGTKIARSTAASPSILLIEQALLYAKKHGTKEVIAFSRPAGFRNYLRSLTN